MSTQDQPSQLYRGLGPWMAIAMVVGNVIGSGIFLKPGNIAAASGNFGLIVSVWLVGGGLCVLGAMCFVELATMFPQAGGIYVYLKKAYGDLTAFLFGWTEFILLRPASIGALSVAFVGSLATSLNLTESDLLEWILCSVLILFMAWINVLGVIWGGRMQLATTLVKAGFLVLVAASPILLAPLAGWEVTTDNFAPAKPTAPGADSWGAQFALVLLAVMWAYDGWHGLTPLAEEVRDPQRNIPLALFGGIGILVTLYVGCNLAYHAVLSMPEMQAAGDHAAEQMLYKLAGRGGQVAMSAVIMCSTFGAINSNILMAPRIPFAMGRDGLFFRSLGAVHANYQTPVVSILATSVMAIGLVGLITLGKLFVSGPSSAGLASGLASFELTRPLLHSLQDDSTFSLLTNCFIFVASAFYMLAVFAVVVLRFRLPNETRSYRTWGYPFVPFIFTAVYVWFLVQIYGSNPVESRTGLLFILIGLPAYWGIRKWNSAPRNIRSP